MKNRSLTVITVLCAVFSISVHADLTGTHKSITVDGSLDDWSNPADVLYDDTEITDGSPSNSSYEAVYVANDSYNLYIGIDTKGPEGGAFSNSWTHTVYMDTDMNPATGFTAGWMANGYDRMIQYGVGGTTYSVYEFTGASQADWGWNPLGSITHAYNDDTLEFSVPLTVLGLSTNTLVMEVSVTGTGIITETWAYEPEEFAETYTVAPGEEPYIKTITLDGILDEWDSVGELFYSDAEIADGSPSNSSYEAVYLVNDAFNLYLGLDMKGSGGAAITNTWNHDIFIDTDMNPATGFDGGWMVNGYDRLIQYGAGGGAANVYEFTGATQAAWSWTNALGAISYGYNDDAAELSVPLSLLNLTTNSCVVELAVSGVDVTVQTWAAQFENLAKTYTVREPELRTITLDGSLADWHSTGDVFYNDAQIGDGSPSNTSYETVYLANDSTNLFVGLDMKGSGGAAITNTWKHNIYLDTDADSGTGFNSGWMVNGYDCLVEYGSDTNGGSLYTLYEFTGAAQSNWSWSALGSIEYAYSDDVAELAIPLSLLNVSGGSCVVELNVTGTGITTETWASEFETAAKTYSIVYADGAKPIGTISMVSISSATGMVLSWDAYSGQAYDVEYKNDLMAPLWLNYTSLVAETDGGITVTTAVDQAETFYQVVTP